MASLLVLCDICHMSQFGMFLPPGILTPTNYSAINHLDGAGLKVWLCLGSTLAIMAYLG